MAVAKAEGIRLNNTEVVTTSEEWDDCLGMWFFYESDSDILAYQVDGTSEMIKEKFLDELAASKSSYLFSEMPKVHFAFDSHENVINNYQGNYFFRLR